MTPPLPLKVRLLRPALSRLRPALLAERVKRLAGIERLVMDTEVGCLLVDPISVLGSTLIDHGRFEPGMVQTLRHMLPAGGIFVDVGANEGVFTVLGGSLVGPEGRVVAVEPQARLRRVIEANLELNGIHHTRLYDVAVSDRAGTAALHLTPDTNNGASGLARQTRYRLPTQQVETVTLAELFDRAGLGRVDLMKMDIEGFEYEAILGSPGVFRNGQVVALALESHPEALARRGRDAEDIVRFLRDCGYALTHPFGNALFVRG